MNRNPQTLYGMIAILLISLSTSLSCTPPAEQNPPDSPCVNLACGHPCTSCQPDAPDCEEPAPKACNAAGECVEQTPNLCTAPYDSCDGKTCGEQCTQCDPNDPDCSETEVLKACNPTGECVPDTEDLCGDPAPPYEPCEGKSCGDTCTQCDPNDPDCFESAVLKACDPTGQCVADTEDLCGDSTAPYDPCEGKTCGEQCTQCDPNDPDCSESEVLKACDPTGQCVADTEDLCGDSTAPYDPCEGKTCGEQCTQCDPNDPDCFETMEIKACDLSGQCVSFTENLCDENNDCSLSVLPPDNFMNSLQGSGGCGDLYLYALSDDGTMEVVVQIPGVCEQAHSQSSLSLQREYTLPDEAVSVRLRMGTNVSDATCDDALEGPIQVDHEFEASGGTLQLTVTPEGELGTISAPAYVDAILTNLEFKDNAQCTSTVDSYTWTNVYVGWPIG